MTDEIQLTRRNFLGAATLTIGGLIGVGYLIPGVAYIIGPAAKTDESTNWIPVGSTAKVEVGTPTLFKVKVARKAGWIESEEEISVFILTDDGREYIAMSNICTHLGCRVRWIADRQEFLSPCHNGIFDKHGDVVSGPPPRPLDRYQVKVEDNQLHILVG